MSQQRNFRLSPYYCAITDQPARTAAVIYNPVKVDLDALRAAVAEQAAAIRSFTAVTH